YADRGSDETVSRPTAKLAVTTSPDGSLTADASGSIPGWVPIASYTFDFGDGTAPVTQPAPTATHQYAQPGTYALQVTVTDSNAVTGSASLGGCVAWAAASAAQRLAADFNGDGRDDLALLYNYGGGHVAVFSVTHPVCGQYGAPALRWDAPR